MIMYAPGLASKCLILILSSNLGSQRLFLNNLQLLRTVTAKLQRPPIRTHPSTHLISLPHLTTQHQPSKRLKHFRPHNPRNRPCAIHLRIPLLREPATRLRIDVERDTPVAHARGDVCEPQVDDGEVRGAGELVEEERGVEAVEQLRREVCFGACEDGGVRGGCDDSVICGCILQGEDVAAQVTCQAYDRVLSSNQVRLQLQTKYLGTDMISP